MYFLPQTLQKRAPAAIYNKKYLNAIMLRLEKILFYLFLDMILLLSFVFDDFFLLCFVLGALVPSQLCQQ